MVAPLLVGLGAGALAGLFGGGGGVNILSPETIVTRNLSSVSNVSNQFSIQKTITDARQTTIISGSPSARAGQTSSTDVIPTLTPTTIIPTTVGQAGKLSETPATDPISSVTGLLLVGALGFVAFQIFKPKGKK